MGIRDFLGEIGDTLLTGDVASIAEGALGRRAQLRDREEEKKEEEDAATDQSFLNVLEQGQAEGSALIQSLVEATNSQLNNKANPIVQSTTEILNNYKNVYNNISPDKRQSLYNLLQQDRNAFRGDPEVVGQKVDEYFMSPTFKFDDETKARTEAITGPYEEGMGIRQLEGELAGMNKKVLDTIIQGSGAANTKLIVGLDNIMAQFPGKELPKELEGATGDVSGIQTSLGEMVNNFQLEMPGVLDPMTMANATGWAPVLSTTQIKDALLKQDPSLLNDPLSLNIAVKGIQDDNIKAAQMKYGPDAIEKLKASGLIFDDSITSQNIFDLTVSRRANEAIDNIANDNNATGHATVNRYRAIISSMGGINPNNKEHVEIALGYTQIRNQEISNAQNELIATGYFNDQAEFTSSTNQETQDPMLQFQLKSTGATYTINPNMTPEGILVAYNINDLSDTRNVNIEDIFPVGGNAAKFPFSTEKLEYIQNLVRNNYPGGEEKLVSDMIKLGKKVDPTEGQLLNEMETESELVLDTGDNPYTIENYNSDELKVPPVRVGNTQAITTEFINWKNKYGEFWKAFVNSLPKAPVAPGPRQKDEFGQFAESPEEFQARKSAYNADLKKWNATVRPIMRIHSKIEDRL